MNFLVLWPVIRKHLETGPEYGDARGFVKLVSASSTLLWTLLWPPGELGGRMIPMYGIG